MVLQLTPLLDLLLIVVFAQYMDLQQTSQRTLASIRTLSKRQTDRAQRQRTRAEGERDDARRVRDNCLNEATAKAKTISELRAEQDQLRKDLADAQQAKLHALRDLQQIAKLLSELLNIPDQALKTALKDLPAEGKRKIRKALEDLRGKGAHAIIRHLRKQEELKKRVDIWEIHIGDKNILTVMFNGRKSGTGFRIRNSDDFRLKLERRFRAEPEPKSLVLLLASHSGGATRRTRRDAETGLVALCKGLRAKYEGKKRFEAALIGLIAKSPTPTPAPPRPSTRETTRTGTTSKGGPRP